MNPIVFVLCISRMVTKLEQGFVVQQSRSLGYSFDECWGRKILFWTTRMVFIDDKIIIILCWWCSKQFVSFAWTSSSSHDCSCWGSSLYLLMLHNSYNHSKKSKFIKTVDYTCWTVLCILCWRCRVLGDDSIAY